MRAVTRRGADGLVFHHNWNGQWLAYLNGEGTGERVRAFPVQGGGWCALRELHIWTPGVEEPTTHKAIGRSFDTLADVLANWARCPAVETREDWIAGRRIMNARDNAPGAAPCFCVDEYHPTGHERQAAS